MSFFSFFGFSSCCFISVCRQTIKICVCGLTAASTGQITGNLVKSKLKVAEQYVHILPMNTQVTVEGVKVILLDANQ